MIGMKWALLVSLSTITQIALQLFDSGNCVIKSVEIISQGLLGTLLGTSGPKGCCGQFFHLLTHITTHNIFLDKCCHPRPLVISGDQLIGLLPTWVSSGWQIMVYLNNLLLQGVFYTVGNINLSSVQE